MRGPVRLTVLAAAAVALLFPSLMVTGQTASAARAPSSAGPDTSTQAERGAGAQGRAVAAATTAAKSTGKPVTITSLTTATTVTTADPDGRLTVIENLTPVRVHQGGSWVPVSTTLARQSDGRIAPRAVPGDAVSFSAGGTGPAVTIAAAGTSLSLSWPGALPVPAISGSSATYRNVLPGVDLVLTATSDQSGGFSGVLVVHSATAARNPALRRLHLSVASRGVRLAGYQGGLVAAGKGVAGYYRGTSSAMWDSSAFPVSRTAPSKSSAAARTRSARSAGATLAPAGSGPASSSAAGPASGAQIANVGTSVTGSGTGLALTLDTALLTSTTTTFPVYAAVTPPTFEWSPATGIAQDRDEVQSACPTASHYDAPDAAGDTYWSLGVGYDDWGDGDCNGADGSAYSYYQMSVPSGIYGGHLYTAQANMQQAWAASCSTDSSVTLSQTGGIGTSTDWDNAPGVLSNLDTMTVSPNQASCGTTYSTNAKDWSTVGFNVLSAMSHAASARWSTFTFRLWEQGSPTDTEWERYGPSPQVAIQYNQTPDTPTSLHISSGTTEDADCLSSTYPWVGELATSGPGTAMTAGVVDKGGDEMAGHFTYWVNGEQSTTEETVDSEPASSGSAVTAEIPASYTNDLTGGEIVDWDVYAYDGALAAYGPDSGTSATCHFYVYPEAPTAPAISGGPGSTSPTPGTAETFTLTAASESGATPKAIVWGLDEPPAVTSPVAAHVIPISSGSSATVTAYVPSGGPHAFYAYTEYSTGPVSQLATDEFSASADPDVTCPSFSAALTNSGCTETTSLGTTIAAPSTAANQMISNGSSDESGTGNADGNGSTLSAAELKAVGWNSGETVTVDGATFTLPDFGSSGSEADNLLAANQTIDMPANTQGSSLVFLAAGTNADAPAPEPSDLGYANSPTLAAGTSEVGSECDSYQTGQSINDNPVCTEAPTGTITYTSASGAPQESYDLEVPDWWHPTPSTAVVTMPEYSSATGLASHSVGIYAISVPINPDAPIASITLPDVGALVGAAADAGWPAIHIFGIAVSNTTTATPGSTATDAGGPWTGAWASPPEASHAPYTGTEYDDQTIRIVTQASVGGTGLRLRLSDALAAAGTGSLSIGAVTVGEQASSGGAAVTSATPVTFGGSSAVTIPEGTDVYSDPVSLPVTAGEYLTVSIDLTGTYASLPTETLCDSCDEYVTATSAGDQTANTDGSPFSGTGTFSGRFDTILTGVDVLAGGLPTVAVLGDGVIDGNTTGTPDHAALRVSDDLADTLQLQPGGPSFGVVSAGIEANQVLTDVDTGTGSDGGPSALSRLARDVLAEPGIGTVILNEGEEDLLQGAAEQDVYGDGLGALSGDLTDWGITTIWATLPACYGYSPSADPCTSTVDSARTTLNTDLLAEGENPQQGCSPTTAIPPCQYTVDFSTAVGNTSSPQQLTTAADVGDFVNLTDAGYQAEADTIPVIAGQPTPLSAAIPPDW